MKGPASWHRIDFRDQFVLQENGFGQVVGRIKDMIIRGGENIFPKEIEQVLEQHSEILEAQVTGYVCGDNEHSPYICGLYSCTILM